MGFGQLHVLGRNALDLKRAIRRVKEGLIVQLVIGKVSVCAKHVGGEHILATGQSGVEQSKNTSAEVKQEHEVVVNLALYDLFSKLELLLELSAHAGDSLHRP